MRHNPATFDVKIWDSESNEAIMLPFQPLNGASIDDLVNMLPQINLLSHLQPLNLRAEEVYITSFPEGSLLITFVIYNWHTGPF